nr:MAG TPA: hypothetical protein [Caudoviricetes sp.]
MTPQKRYSFLICEQISFFIFGIPKNNFHFLLPQSLGLISFFILRP